MPRILPHTGSCRVVALARVYLKHFRPLCEAKINISSIVSSIELVHKQEGDDTEIPSTLVFLRQTSEDQIAHGLSKFKIQNVDGSKPRGPEGFVNQPTYFDLLAAQVAEQQGLINYHGTVVNEIGKKIAHLVGAKRAFDFLGQIAKNGQIGKFAPSERDLKEILSE